MKTEVKTKYPEFKVLADAEKNLLMRLWRVSVEASFFADAINKPGEDEDFWKEVDDFLHPDLKTILEVGETMLRNVDVQNDTPKSIVRFAIEVAEDRIKPSQRWNVIEHSIDSYLSEMAKYMDEYHRETIKLFNN